MKELLERLEKATGPDADILFSIPFTLAGPEEVERRIIIREMGDFTASLDAALSLVEEEMPGWSIQITISDLIEAQVYFPDPDGEWHSAQGATPALALLKALLLALSEQTRDGSPLQRTPNND